MSIPHIEHLDVLATMEFNQAIKRKIPEDDLRALAALLVEESAERTHGHRIVDCGQLDDWLEAWRWRK